MIKTDSLYRSKRTFSWLSPKAIIKDTDKYGMGVYANQKIKKNEKIAMFGGYVMTRDEESSSDENVYDNAIQIDDNLVIGAKTKEEIEDASMFNHSCDANSGIKGQILLVAIKDIKPGEQITFDFGTVLYHYKGIKKYKLKCLCMNKNCRGIITEEDWKIKDVQERYKGYFPSHIQEKIDKIKKYEL